MKSLKELSILWISLVTTSLLVTPLFVHASENKCAVPLSSAPVGNPQPTTGTVRALFIFVKFSDDTFENDCTGEWNHITYNTTRPPWTNQIIDSSIMTNQTPGSLSDYFDRVSYDQFQMIGDIYPQDNLVYVPLHPESYYVRNTSYSLGDPLRRGIGYFTAFSAWKSRESISFLVEIPDGCPA